jgi:hypothetical protein
VHISADFGPTGPQRDERGRNLRRSNGRSDDP